MRGIDLGAMRKAENTVIGFEVAEGFVNGQKEEDGKFGMAVPVLEVKFLVANGEARKPFCVTLGLVLPLISTLSEWGLKHSTTTVETL